MRVKLLSVILMCVVLVFSAISVYAEENKSIFLTDSATDFSYRLVCKDGYIEIYKDDLFIANTYVKDFDACSICGGIVTFYKADSLNKSLLIYTWEIYEDSISSYAINTDAYLSENCFASDEDGNVYYVLNDNNKTLAGFEKDINLNAQIKQLLYIQDEGLLAVTADSTYIFRNSEAEKILDYPLSVPVRYIGNGTVKDISENFFSFSEPEITLSETLGTKPELESDIYFAQAGTTVSKIKKAFASFEITKIAKADGKIIDSGKVGTGTTLTFESGEEVTVIILGELTGEGNINSRDLKAILNHLSEKEILNGYVLLAADADCDQKITTKDALLIANMY